jgi:hypothetical protein
MSTACAASRSRRLTMIRLLVGEPPMGFESTTSVRIPFSFNLATSIGVSKNDSVSSSHISSRSPPDGDAPSHDNLLPSHPSAPTGTKLAAASMRWPGHEGEQRCHSVRSDLAPGQRPATHTGAGSPEVWLLLRIRMKAGPYLIRLAKVYGSTAMDWPDSLRGVGVMGSQT